MGLPLEVNNLMLGSLSGYTVGRSLRFRSSASAYLNRTPASAGNRRTWTWSGWVKRGTLGSAQWVFDAFQDANNFTAFFFNSDNTFGIQYVLAGTSKVLKYTTQFFRDPSAWYHIMVVADTTPATPTFTVYVNGSQVTAFGTNTNTVSQNEQLFVNNTVAHNVGRYGGAANYFDGYLAEVNFIDGQALTPSSFGAYDTNGVWQPKKYSGTYGTNGFYLPFNWSTSTSYAGSFNGSTQYLTVPTNTAFDFGSGDWTIEAWVLTDTTSNRNIVAREWGGSGGGYTGYVFSTTQLVASTADGAWQVNFTWSLPSANQWHHYAAVRNGNVFSVYIDGIRVGTQTVAGTLLNGFGSAFTIGYRNGQSLPSGSISNLRVVKGTAVYTSNFTPPTSALTAISGTSLLTLQSSTVIDNSTNAFTITNVGSVAMAASSPFGASVLADASGNNNGWSGNNINYSAYGTTYDSMVDSPTNAAGNSNGIGNYAVLNAIKLTDPGATATAEISQGNLAVINTRAANNVEYVVSTIGVTSGKWYYEATMGGNPSPGLQWVGINTSDYGSGSSIRGYRNDNGQYYNGSAWSAYGASYASGDVIGIAFDLDSQTIEFFKNGTSQSQKTSIGLSGIVMHAAAAITQGSGAFYFNFGQRPFSYTPPSGFKALNTYNLPAPSIAAGNKHFDISLWTGTGVAQAITNSGGFQPDLVWNKSRNNGGLTHIWTDSVRGVNSQLFSPLTNAQETRTDRIQSFDASGFTVGTYTDVNQSAQTFVGWQWKGGGTAVTNNSGTITSTVSANTTAGFSIVSWTGNGTAGATVGHGLGVTPNMVFIKNRSSAGSNWIGWHSSVSQAVHTSSLLTLNTYTNAIYLNLTLASQTYTFDSQINGSTNNLIAYCFSAVRGYSAFGSYTGNGSADGPFIYTGFRPRWVMIKNTQDGTTNWYIYDTSRDTYNIMSNYLMSNLSNAEASFSAMDYLSNGFKIRTSNLNFNNSGQTHIYAAFAESPFQISRAR